MSKKKHKFFITMEEPKEFEKTTELLEKLLKNMSGSETTKTSKTDIFGKEYIAEEETLKRLKELLKIYDDRFKEIQKKENEGQKNKVEKVKLESSVYKENDSEPVQIPDLKTINFPKKRKNKIADSILNIVTGGLYELTESIDDKISSPKEKLKEELFETKNSIVEFRSSIEEEINARKEALEQYKKSNLTQTGGITGMMKESIESNKKEDENWEFSEDANELYALYFKKRREQYEGNAEEIQKIQEEEAERQKRLLEHSNQIQKETQEQSQTSRLEAEKQKTQKEQELLQEEIANRTEASNKMGNIETQKADEILKAKTNATSKLIEVDDTLVQKNKKVEQSEADSHKTRAQQWQEYAEKVSAISQQISEVTGMVTNSLGGMFSQLSESYAQEIESLNEKIAAVDEEKEAALERVALSEDERRAKEEELAQQKINLEYATTEEQKNKADERIATLQGELGAEDSINRDFESKKASLEKEKEKKEKAQKKAEKMQKRLEMGQAIVEAIGNIAQGAAKALGMGPILGPILAAVVSAAGAVQVGIMTKQLAKMEDGGLLRGKRHSQGGMRIQGSNIEVEGGEYVVNRQSTNKNLGLLGYINSQRRELDSNDLYTFFSTPFPRFQRPEFTSMFEGGGQVPTFEPNIDISNSELLAAMQNLRIDSHVSVTDINTVQQNMTRVDEWTGL